MLAYRFSGACQTPKGQSWSLDVRSWAADQSATLTLLDAKVTSRHADPRFLNVGGKPSLLITFSFSTDHFHDDISADARDSVVPRRGTSVYIRADQYAAVDSVQNGPENWKYAEISVKRGVPTVITPAAKWGVPSWPRARTPTAGFTTTMAAFGWQPFAITLKGCLSNR